ncbi:MAG TPA: hypothetical protein VGN17_20875 [Bryobacteraceae bacterium]|jgi:uncharacterized protein (TIGR03437 family)
MNCPKNVLLAAAAVIAAVCCSDTAFAQPTLTVTPATVTNPATPLPFINIPSGGASKTPQSVSVSASSSTSIIVQVSSTSPWLTVNGSSISALNVGSGTGVNLNVSVNTNAGGQIFGTGTYSGFFTISINGTTVNQVTVYVSMTVTGTSLLSANPNSLAFTANQGASFATPTGCTNAAQNGCLVQIASSGAALTYNLQATSNGGSNWLLLSTTSGTTGDAGFLVSVNPAALAPTTTTPYTGTIIAQSTSTADSVTISVSLTVTSSASLSVTPASPPPFLYQVGKEVPQPQQLMITATGGTANFNVRANPSVSWLVLSNFSGQASSTSPFPLTLSVNPAGLTASTYTTSIVVTASGGSDLPGIPISLVVSNNALLKLSASSLSYTAQFSTTPPPDQQVMITAGNGAATSFTVSSDSTWLQPTASAGTTPFTLTIHVNPAGLLVQNYTGTITIRPNNGDTYTETIAVSLNVVNASAVTAGPPDLLFSYQLGQQNQPSQQTIQLSTSGPSVPITISTTTSSCGQNWLQASLTNSSTPATVTAGVSTTGLTAGTCSGTITVAYNSGSGQVNLAIPVTLAVSANAELVISMQSGFGNETVPVGSGAFSRQIALTSTDPNTNVTFSAIATSTGGTWLLVGAGNNLTPQNLVVQFLPGGLAPGTYTGQVVISSTSLGSTQLTIPVTLTVTPNVTVTVSASTLTFTEAQGGALPAAQTLSLSSAGGTATYTASIASITGGNWLQISPTSGQASGTIQVSILANNLSQGDYPAQILLTYQGANTASATVNVTLHVSQPQTITLTTTSLNFAYQLTGGQPAPQKISVAGSSGVNFSVGTTSSGWLSTDIIKGTTPQDITVSVNTANLTPGSYMGTVSVSAPTVSGNPTIVNVTLTITAAPLPQPGVIVSAASGVAGVISPGELISIKGTNLGPATPANGVSFTVNGAGAVDSKLAGVRVLFDTIPGTPIYVSATQINVSVPYEVAGRLSTTMVVEYQGIQSAGIPLRLADTALGLFTNDFSGRGQVAAFNQNGTLNGSTGGYTPAPADSEITVYATGGGVTSPPATTGTVTKVPASAADLVYLPAFLQGTVTATVGGQPAKVDFAGNAPGIVTGIVQFNVHIPKGVSGNNTSVILSINGATSPLGTTIAVQ